MFDRRILLILVALLAGCQRQSYDVVEVAGRVTFNGKPLTDAQLTFQPSSQGNATNPGPASYAKTDSDGRFALRLVTDDRPGAVPGPHCVYITTSKTVGTQNDFDAAPVQHTAEVLPAPYWDGSIVINIPADGLPSAELNLTPDGKLP